MDTLLCYYEILGLKPDATSQEVRRAYRELVRVWHPDRFGDDLHLQQLAQEKLKEINEAYRVVKVDLAAHPRSETLQNATAQPSAKPAPAPPTVDEKVAPPHRPAPSSRRPIQSPFTLGTLLPFFSSWQNALFLVLAAGCIRFTVIRYGTFFNGAGYALEMLALPLVFAFLCNSHVGGRRYLWGVYVAVLLLFGGLVLYDAVTFKKELQEAGSYRYAAPADGGGYTGGGGGGWPSETGSAPFSVQDRRAPSGPVAPVPPAVPAPEAPSAPAAPIMPPAPPAR
ncbi:MAG: J domain-containing protein [Geobacter sp.]|nr:J domain-containing protein [Geobacter sp.]